MRPKFYFPSEPIFETTFEYESANNNEYLRETVTKTFQNKILDGIKNKNIPALEKQFNLLNSDKGYHIIYKILKRYVKKNLSRGNDVNWWDLEKMEKNVMEYIQYKLNKKLL